MNLKTTSNHTLVEENKQPAVLSSYELQKRIRDLETQGDPKSKSYLGMLLFVIGFIIPISWIIGAVICFTKGHNYSKKWGIANVTATALLVLGLTIWVAYIIISGNAYSDNSNKAPVPIF